MSGNRRKNWTRRRFRWRGANPFPVRRVASRHCHQIVLYPVL